VITAAGFVSLAALGAVLRALAGHRLNRGLPLGTLVVNVTGSFALGVLHGAAPPVVTAVGTGGLGAYTTFSSFARDAVALVEERRPLAAAAYVLGTCALTVAAAWAGLVLA
jgi:CrcB protein